VERPGFASASALSKGGGRREGRVPTDTRGPRADKNARGRNHRHSRDDPAFPARWLYGLYVLSPGTGFLAPVIGAMRKHRRQLDASTGTSGPYDFAVRIGAVRLRENTALQPDTPTASRTRRP
jgi:hypothetical protein